MSSSDEPDQTTPDSPDTPTVIDDTASDAAGAATAPASTAPAPAGAAPAPASTAPAPTSAAAPPASPSGPADASDDEAAARHAALRPAPEPPGPAPAASAPLRVPLREVPPATPTARTAAPTTALPPATSGTATMPVTPAVTAATAASAAAPAGSGPGAAAPASRAPRDESLFPDPNAPRSITVATHAVGVVVGIVLPVVAAAVTLLGNSRILAVEANGWVAQVETLGIVLVTLGVLLLVACALLSLWTPSVGLVGGTLLTLGGAFALYAPGLARTAVLDVLSSDEWEPTVIQTVVSMTSGGLLVVGALLLASGIVSAVARRHGVRLGAFRERHRTA